MAKVIEEGVLREIFKATSHILKTPIKNVA
jgi:hypothetical protein